MAVTATHRVLRHVPAYRSLRAVNEAHLTFSTISSSQYLGKTSVSDTSKAAELMPHPLFHWKQFASRSKQPSLWTETAENTLARPLIAESTSEPFPPYDDGYALHLLEAEQRVPPVYHKARKNTASAGISAEQCRTPASVKAGCRNSTASQASSPATSYSGAVQIRHDSVISQDTDSDASSSLKATSLAPEPAHILGDANGVYDLASQTVLQRIHGFPYDLRSHRSFLRQVSENSPGKESTASSDPTTSSVPSVLHTLHGFPYIEAVAIDKTQDDVSQVTLLTGLQTVPRFPKQSSGIACLQAVKQIVRAALPARHGVREIVGSVVTCV